MQAAVHPGSCNLLPSLLVGVHGKEHVDVHLAGERAGVVVVGQRGEGDALDERVEASWNIVKVDGRTGYEPVGLQNGFEHRREPVFEVALEGFGNPLAFAGHAATAAVVVQAVQVDVRNLVASRLRSSLRLLQNLRGVPVFPGAAVEDDGFHGLPFVVSSKAGQALSSSILFLCRTSLRMSGTATALGSS